VQAQLAVSGDGGLGLAVRCAACGRLDPVELAFVAVQPQEAVGQDAAAKVGAQLVFNEVGCGLAAFARPEQEGLDLVANGLVQQRRPGRARLVLVGSVAGEGRMRARTAPCSCAAARQRSRMPGSTW